MIEAPTLGFYYLPTNVASATYPPPLEKLEVEGTISISIWCQPENPHGSFPPSSWNSFKSQRLEMLLLCPLF